MRKVVEPRALGSGNHLTYLFRAIHMFQFYKASLLQSPTETGLQLQTIMTCATASLDVLDESPDCESRRLAQKQLGRRGRGLITAIVSDFG